MSVTVTEDHTTQVLRSIQLMSGRQLVVGVPEEENPRKEDGDIGNAAIAYINDNGSPKLNIPARPFMVPGFRASLPRGLRALKFRLPKAFKDPSQVDKGLEDFGDAARESIQNTIRSQGSSGDPSERFEDLSPVTLKLRKAKGFVGKKSLIVTGSLLNSINYIVRRAK